MKKQLIKTIVCVALAVSMTMGTMGCSLSSGEQAEVEQKTPTDVPDYSDSDKKMNMYAHISPTPGWYTNYAGQAVFTEDHRTLENYQEYKDCGFDTLFLQGNDAYNGEDFETSDTKKNMDRCQQVGLRCIVFDNRIWALSKSTESLVGEGKQFATLQELADTLEGYMKPYINHPTFYGVALFDEPHYNQIDAMSEVTKALKMVKEDIYVKTTMLPYASDVSVEWYTGKTFGNTSIGAYKTYMEKYMETSEADFYNYDDYPFRENGVLSTYYQTLQTVVNKAKEYHADVELIVQSFAVQGRFREVDKEDLLCQSNAALAFGVKNLVYFTYWMHPGGGSELFTAGIMDHKGNKMIYDEVKEVNAWIQELAKVMLCFDYEKAFLTYDVKNAITAPTTFAGVKSEELDSVKVDSVTQPTIVTQMKDEEHNRTGYMVLNIEDTMNDSEDQVTLTFEGYDFVTCYQLGQEPETKQLQDGTIKVTLGTGGGMFLIPHN